jgi:G3E family GTPase
VSRVPVRIVTSPTEVAEGWAVLRPRGCPCCTGRVQTQVELTRLIREQRPRGVVIELRGEGHVIGVHRALGEWPLADYVEL